MVKVSLTLFIISFHYYITFYLMYYLLYVLTTKKKIDDFLLAVLEDIVFALVSIHYFSHFLYNYEKIESTFLASFSFFNLKDFIEFESTNNLIINYFFLTDYTIIIILYIVLIYFKKEKKIFFIYMLILIYFFYTTTFALILIFFYF